MGLVRVITIGLVIWLGWMLYRRFILQKKNIPSNAKAKQTDNVAAMRQCAVCGVHVPQEEALYKNNKYYCCQQHSDQA
ncbi:MAG: PP0621 family protein [Gammaproteobacteria bacterium]|nr:PP0621 family protein [Gammaproteobacteria bacterium]